MKPRAFGLLAALFALLLTTLPSAHAQQVSTPQSVTFRVLQLPESFRNTASFVEWSYTPTDETLRVGNQANGIILLGKHWTNGNVWLPLGLTSNQSQLNLQLNPCHSNSTSTWGEAYNDRMNWVLVDGSVLNDSFTMTLYTDDANDQGAGQKLVLSSADFAQTRAIEMIALTAPADSFGKVSGLTSSLPDSYDQIVEDIGGLWLGNNGLPIRGVGLNQGEDRFTSTQVPPCSPMGPEFVNDLGDSILLLPRDTACTPGQITLHENDLDGVPSGMSWPIALGPDLCAPTQATFAVSADISLAPEFCGESAQISGHIVVQADSEPPAGSYSFTLADTTYPLQFSNEFAAGTPVTVTVTTGVNSLSWALLHNQTAITTGTLEIVGTSTGPCRPRDEDESTRVYLALIAVGQPDRAGDEASCADGRLVITNDFGRYERPLDSDTELAVPNLPYLSPTTFTAEGAEDVRFIKYSPLPYESITANPYIYPGGNPGSILRLEVFSKVGDKQCHAVLDVNVDP